MGINSNDRIVYVCEVATHLQNSGLQHTKNKRPDNINRITEKFQKDIEYANRNFSEFTKEFMLWTSIARKSKDGSSTNPYRDLQIIKNEIKKNHDVDLMIVANEEYLKAIKELREVAAKKT